LWAPQGGAIVASRNGVGPIAIRGDALKQWRERRGLSQRDLAAKARLAPETIDLIESGRRRFVYPKTVGKLVAALGIAPGDLLHDPDPA
jgi:transcriptional regulator with XRE-family HTH domain